MDLPVRMHKNMAMIIGFPYDQIKPADVNFDGYISMVDVTIMQKYIANLIRSFG